MSFHCVLCSRPYLWNNSLKKAQLQGQQSCSIYNLPLAFCALIKFPPKWNQRCAKKEKPSFLCIQHPFMSNGLENRAGFLFYYYSRGSPPSPAAAVAAPSAAPKGTTSNGLSRRRSPFGGERRKKSRSPAATWLLGSFLMLLLLVLHLCSLHLSPSLSGTLLPEEKRLFECIKAFKEIVAVQVFASSREEGIQKRRREGGY